MASNNFNRFFVMLEPMDGGFGLNGGKEPAGYCKFEIRKNRGRLHIYLQDLKPIDKDKGIYELVLLSTRGGISPIRLAGLKIGEDGKYEEIMDFDPANINGSGHGLNMFQGIAVVPVLKSEGKARIALTGLIDKRAEPDFRGIIADWLAPSHLTGAEAPEGQAMAETTTKEDLTEEPPKEEWPLAEEDEADDIYAAGYKAESLDAGGETIGGADLPAEADPMTRVPDSGGPDQNDIKDLAVDNEAARDDDHFEYEITYPNEYDKEPIDLEGAERANSTEGSGSAGNLVTGEGTEDVESTESLDSLEGSESTEIDDSVETTEDAEFGADFDNLSPEDFEYEYTYDEPYDYRDYFDDLNKEHYKEPAGAVTYWDKVKGYYNTLFESRKKVCPFDAPGEVDWVRIDGLKDDPASNAYYGWGGYHPGWNRPDHYLVGLQREKGKVKYVIYGLPGMYSAVPPMSIYGLSKWLPKKNGQGMGYWLLYIDAETGEIAYPDQ